MSRQRSSKAQKAGYPFRENPHVETEQTGSAKGTTSELSSLTIKRRSYCVYFSDEDSAGSFIEC